MAEPTYRGANGRIDAIAAAWLLSQDYVFFDKDDIVWDGKRHVVTGIQLNANKVEEIPELMNDPQGYLRGVVDLMMALEEDEGLRMTRSKMHRSLREVLGENGLTGAALFGLQAHGQVFSLVSATTAFCNKRARRKALDAAKKQVEGIDPGNVIAVAVDPRLPKCIPGFYALVRRMVADMYAYNGEDDKAFVLVFVDQECPRANQLFHGMRAPFKGAVYEPLHVEYRNIRPTGVCEPRDVSLGDSQWTGLVGGKKLVGGKTAKGRRFTVTLSEGWTIYKDCYDKARGFTRSFVAVRGGKAGKYNPDACTSKDRVLYAPNNDDTSLLDCGYEDVCWARCFYASYGSDALGKSVWDTEVQAVNTKCFVVQKEGPAKDVIKFWIHPYALDHSDFIQCEFTCQGHDDLERLRSLACQIASSVDLDKPLVSSCDAVLAQALGGRVPIDAFCKMVGSFASGRLGVFSCVCEAAIQKHANQFDGASEDDLAIAGLRDVANYGWRAVPIFNKLMDAYAVQVAGGTSLEERGILLSTLEIFNAFMFPTVDMFTSFGPGEEDLRNYFNDLINRTKAFEPPADLVEVRKRLERAKKQAGLGE